MADRESRITFTVDPSAAVSGIQSISAEEKKLEQQFANLGNVIDKAAGVQRLKIFEDEIRKVFAASKDADQVAASLNQISEGFVKNGASADALARKIKEVKSEIDAVARAQQKAADDTARAIQRAAEQEAAAQQKAAQQAISAHQKAAQEAVSAQNQQLASIQRIVAAYLSFQGIRILISNVERAFRDLGDTLDRAFKAENIETQFKTLQASIGETADATLPRLRSATRGLVSDFDLMRAANKAVLAEVDKSTPEYANLIGNVTKLAQAMGQDAAGAIDRVTSAISHQRPAQLATLGIVVKAAEAQQQYAAAHDKSVSALTTSEKRLALYNAVVQEAARAAGNLISQQDTAATVFQQVTATLENQKNKFAEGVSASSSLKDELAGLRDVLQSINFEQVGRDVGDLASNLVKAASGAASFGAELASNIALNLKVMQEQSRVESQAGFFSKYGHQLLSDLTFGTFGQGLKEQAQTNVAQQVVSAEDERIVKQRLDNIAASVKAFDSQAKFDNARKQMALFTADALKNGVNFDTFRDKFDALQKSLGNGEKSFQATGKSMVANERAAKEAADAQEALAKQTKSTNDDIERQAAKVALVAGKDGFPALTAAIKEAIATGKNSTEIAANLKKVNEEFTKQGVSADEIRARVDSAFGAMSKSIRQGASDAQKFQKELEKIGQDLADATINQGRLKDLQDSIKNIFAGAFAGGDPDVALVNLEKLRQQFVHNQHDAELFDKLVKQGFHDVQEESKKATEDVKRFNEEIVKLNGKSDPESQALTDGLAQVQQQLQEGKISYEDYVTILNLLRQQFILAGGDARVFADDLKNAKQIVDESGSSGSLRGIVNSLFGSSFKAGGFFGFDLGISGPDQKKIEQGLEQSVSSIFTNVFQSLTSGKTLHFADYQNLISQSAGAIANAFLPGSGPVASALTNAIVGLFSHDKSEGTKERRAIDKYFGDLFNKNELQAIIQGKLQGITDFQFTGNQDRSKGIFAGLTNDVKSSFTAVGDALEQIQGVVKGLGVNLDSVLADNLDGNLKNVVALLEKMHVSFEDLGNAIIDSFLKGDESINQAYQDLVKLDQLAHGGAFKDLADAFNTFQESEASGKGSQVLIDSIRAIGAQAEQLHLKTLPDLVNYLTNTLHLDASQVEVFFEAMKASGIKSTEDLVNASTAQLIQFAHNVQAIQSGQAPDTVTPNPTTPSNYTPPANFTAGSFSRSSGSSGGSSSSAASSAKQTLQNLQNLVTASDDYKAVLNGLAAGQLTNAQAGKILNDLYKEGRHVTNDLAAAQKAYDAAVAKSASPEKLAKLAEALDQAKKASDNFGKIDPTLDALKKMNSDLTALGVLAKGAGLDFQTLQDQITQAFENGSLSIDQAKNKIDELTGALQNGGDKNPLEAFQNFLEGGKNGGAFTVEQFKAIFETAQQQGDTSLSQVESQLATKFAPSQVAKIFSVLGQSGFNTFDDLKNISDSAVVDILGKLDKLGFPFQETSNRVKKILDQMNHLKNQQDINIKINFSSNVDAATKNLLQLAGIEVPGQQPPGRPGVGGSKRHVTRKPTHATIVHR